MSRSSDDGGSYAAHLKDLDVSHATFDSPDLTKFCRLDELGLVAVGQLLEPDRAVIACRVVEPDGWCSRCGCRGVARARADPAINHDVQRRLVCLDLFASGLHQRSQCT